MTRGKNNKSADQKVTNTPPGQTAGGGGLSGKAYRVLSHKTSIALILFLVSFAVFIPSLDNGFVWDDNTFIVQAEPYLKNSHIDLSRFKIKSDELKYWRPLFTISLISDYDLWGMSASGFHLTNIILHSVSTVLLYFLILLLCREFKVENGRSTALVSSLLFALFPLHVESVTFISARADIMACILLIGCMSFYVLSYRRLLFLLPAAFLLYLSFFTKEVAYSFPLVIFGFDLISRRIFSRVNLVKYSILIVLLALYFYMRSSSFLSIDDFMHKSTLSELEGIEFLKEFLTVLLASCQFYAVKLLYPYDLNHFIGTIPGGDTLHVLISAVFAAAVIAAFVWSVWKKENITAFSILWIFVTLSPAIFIAIFPIAITRFAERFTYIPSAGFCMLLGYLIILAAGRTRIKWAGWAVAGALCVSYLVVTVRGQEVWQDNLTFWKVAVERTPDQLAPKVNYGEALKAAGRRKEAFEQYEIALSSAIKADGRGKAMAAIPMATAYINEGKYDEAERTLKTALKENPNVSADYNYLMGYIYMKKNDMVTAKKYLEQSLRERSWNANPNYFLGSIYLSEAAQENSPDKYEMARQYLENAVRINPGLSKARILLAKAYLATGRKDEAVAQAKKALSSTNDIQVIKEAKSIINSN